MPWRWVVPVAATIAVVAGAVWQADGDSQRVTMPPPVASPEWRGKGVDLPVLPPRAYWEMSAIEEFETLRPTRPVELSHPSANLESSFETLTTAVPDALSSVPPIVIEDITPEPLAVHALGAPQPIALAPIEIAPIDIASLDKENR